MKLSRLGEFGLIERLRRRLPAGRGVRLGIGDDAAWVENPARSSLVTADMLLDGVHFDLRWTSHADLGFKSLAVNLSDIAAMGGVPAYAVVSLGVPGKSDSEKIEELYRGIQMLARPSGVTIIGGDLSGANVLTISVCVIGHPPRRPVRRAGAAVGDDIYVTGTVGDAALGLKLLQRGARGLKRRGAAYLLSRHHKPAPRLAAGAALAENRLASAMIDVSDGLLQDLGHICRASGTGAAVNCADLPLSNAYLARAGKDGDSFALSGGEDYELLFCARPGKRQKIAELSRRLRLRITRIGQCVAGSRVIAHGRSGEIIAPPRRGHDHFQE